MKILLIQPKAYKHSPGWLTEPLGLGYIAAYTKKKLSDVVFRCVTAIYYSDREIVDLSMSFDIIGITGTSPMFTHGIKLANAIKSRDNKKIIIFGGTHVTSEPEICMKNDSIDFLVLGEGENPFYQLVLNLYNKHNRFASINGLAYRDHGKTVINRSPNYIDDINEIPFPDRKLIRQKLFINNVPNYIDRRTASIISSRGCPFRCSYCASNILWGHKIRFRKPANILQEIIYLNKQFGVTHLNFSDDTFTVSRQRVIDFCRLLNKLKFRLTWDCNAHVNTLNKEMLTAMKTAGCTEIAVGIESGSPNILRVLKKNITISNIKDKVNMIKSAGIKVHGYFMIGVEGETEEDVRKTETLIDSLSFDSISLTIFTPYPGCEIYRKAVAAQDAENIDWANIDLHYIGRFNLSDMTDDILNKIYDELQRKYKHLIETKPLPFIKRMIIKYCNKLRRR